MNFDYNALPDGLIAIFTTTTSSDIYINEYPRYQEMKMQLDQVGVSVVFAVDDSYSDFNVLLKPMVKQNNLGENIIFTSKFDGKLVYLTHKESPETEGNWTDAIKQFAINFADIQPDEKDMWKWGQVVQEDGDYLCVDCGYIGEFKKGEVFPICEVCLSGDPAGPSGPEAGYWEKV